jgi:hypothetical protein
MYVGILNLVASAGAGFDVVSGGELERVLQVGADPAKIVFSGVGKQVRLESITGLPDFFLTQYTKMGKNLPNYHNFTAWPKNIPNGH